MAQKKKQNKQGKQSQRVEINSCQDSPCLAEGRKDVHGRSSSKVQGTSTLESTPPGSETSSLSLHNPLLPFRTSDPSVQLISQENVFTHAHSSLFPVSRYAKRVYDEVRRDAACRLKPSFSLLDPRNHGAEGVVRRSPPRRPSPTPVYPYWRELEATWCAIVDRSTLATLQGCEYISTWNCCRGYFLRMP